MDADEAIIAFLTATLIRRRDRYVEFASRKKARRKFLNEFYHQLSDCFDPKTIVKDLPARAWEMDAYCFAPPNGFGTPCGSLKEGFDDIGEATLLVTVDGKFGIHTAEDSFGGPVFLAPTTAA